MVKHVFRLVAAAFLSSLPASGVEVVGVGDSAAFRFCRDNGAVHCFAQNGLPAKKSFAMLRHWFFLELTEDPDRDVKIR